MHQLDSHMCISWQTLIWEITSSTIWLWAYFHDYPITKMCHWDEHFPFILLWTCHLHEQHKFALRQKKLLWIPPLYVVFGSKPYTSHLWIYGCDIHIWIAPPPFIRMSSQCILRNYCDYEFIDGKISNYCRKYFDDWFGGLYLNFPTLGGQNKSWQRD